LAIFQGNNILKNLLGTNIILFNQAKNFLNSPSNTVDRHNAVCIQFQDET